MVATLSSLLILTTASLHASPHVRFVVTGDDRWDTHHARQGLDDNGVNVTGLGRVVKAVLAEKPNLWLFNGDLVGGAETDEAEASQFETWVKVMQPVYDSGVKVLTVRGNHEMHCPHATEVWRKAMSGVRKNPGISPAGEENLTYAYTFGNCLFLGLDQFKSDEVSINQPWLTSILTAKHAPHVFAFAHKMAFFSGNHDDGMSTIPVARDAFLETLIGAGSRAVFFGHDHLYDHLAATRSGKTIHQFVIGTAGAPFVNTKTLTETDGGWTLKRIGHYHHALGYAIVDVQGSTATIEYKSEKTPGNFEVVDVWKYDLKSPSN
jgi:Calcineurin-like phosphoesterase